MSNDQNLYVSAYLKTPGSQVDGLKVFYETSIGIINRATLVANAPQISANAQGLNPRPIAGMTITFAGYPFAFTDNGTAGAQASIALITLPAKVNLIMPAVVSLALDATATFNPTGNIGSVAQTVWSLGSAAASSADATLTSTEADIMASQAVTLGSGLGSFFGVGAAAFAQDGHSSAKTIYLNGAMADAFSGGNSFIGLTGTIDLTWQPLN